MLDKDFLKKLTILYVEDEDIAREQFGKQLKRLFKNVILGCNGEDGYNKFQEAKSSSEPIDLILSDINMPKMNGLEMLEKIREIDEDVPVMYTTARTEIEYIQRAIELNVHHYALKPINLDDIIIRIQKVCEKQYYQMVINSKNNELKNYLTIINSVAAILKINEEGEITFINNLLCELFNQEKEDLVGKNFTSLFHSDVPSTFSDEILTKVSNNETWKGDIKYEDHSKEAFFIRSTIFKLVKDDGVDEYISIGFLSTQEVEKQREFRKNVLVSISNKSKEASKTKNDVESLRLENKRLQERYDFFNTEIDKYKDKIALHKNQIDYYEKKLSLKDEDSEKKVALRNQVKTDLENSLEKVKREKRMLSTQNSKLEEESLENIKELEKLKHTINQKDKRLEAISEILEHRESQIRKLDPDLLT